ncbi:hypothetical protein NQZ79_g4758 [Umbelopsis isabellina]|nr:hypothetical protein NQZ79_g4758 [Umbelopsis isabellina]
MSEANEILRKRSLQFWLEVNKRKPNMTAELYQNVTVSGQIVAADSECNRIRVDNLQTAMGAHKYAVLRGTDVDKMEVECNWLPLAN